MRPSRRFIGSTFYKVDPLDPVLFAETCGKLRRPFPTPLSYSHCERETVDEISAILRSMEWSRKYFP